VWALSQDLRVQCRQRKLSPAGNRDELAERLKELMLATQDLYASSSMFRYCRDMDAYDRCAAFVQKLNR